MIMNNEKNISEVFSILRTQLQLKEKEFLELQRKDSSLLPPDNEQIQLLINQISSLQLSTSDGSFIFASNSFDDDDSIPCISLCSIDFNTIKNLPFDTWLSKSFHLVPLPMNTNTHFPIANHLLCMPIDVFKPSLQSNRFPRKQIIDSLLKPESIYSKEYWLNRSS